MRGHLVRLGEEGVVVEAVVAEVVVEAVVVEGAVAVGSKNRGLYRDLRYPIHVSCRSLTGNQRASLKVPEIRPNFPWMKKSYLTNDGQRKAEQKRTKSLNPLSF